MEYPTLFTAGTRWLAPPRVTTPEGVTVHEAGHQFWYGIVGNNEFEDAWMDEGFNTFSTARAVAQVYDPNYLALRYFGGFVPWVFRDIALSRETDGNRLAGLSPRRRRATRSRRRRFRYFPATGGNITYNKTALWLNTMERWLGWPTLQQIMSTHFAEWKFTHPDAAAISSRRRTRWPAAISTWFFDQVYRSSNVFDYGVQDLTSTRDGESLPHHASSCAATAKRSFRSTCSSRSRTASASPNIGTAPIAGSCTRYDRPVAGAVGAGRSESRAAARRELHEQLEDAAPQGDRAATKWSLKWMVWLQDCLLSWAALV